MPARNVIHSRAQFFNVKQEEEETLDEYWKRLVDIERKCAFKRITPEAIITYPFAATIYKKARENIKKGPLELRTVLETIEVDKYNRKYAEKKQKNKKQRRVSSGSSSNGEQNAFTRPARKRKLFDTDKKKISNRRCQFCGKPNWTPEHSCPPRKSQCNKCKKTGHFVRVSKTKTVIWIRKGDDTGSNTDSWSEVDHIQSVNSVNRIDFYSAILLVEGQPIEFIIATGSPITIIPQIIHTKELMKATKCFVDVNKNPIKFKGESMVEDRNKKNRVTATDTQKEKQKYTTITRIGLVTQTGNRITG